MFRRRRGHSTTIQLLQEAIKTAEHNSSQLRALVYERARFNLKRDILCK